jgi:hypothetical protein
MPKSKTQQRGEAVKTSDGLKKPISKVAKIYTMSTPTYNFSARRTTYSCAISSCSATHKECFNDVDFDGAICKEHLEQAKAVIAHHDKATEKHSQESKGAEEEESESSEEREEDESEDSGMCNNCTWTGDKEELEYVEGHGYVCHDCCVDLGEMPK